MQCKSNHSSEKCTRNIKMCLYTVFILSTHVFSFSPCFLIILFYSEGLHFLPCLTPHLPSFYFPPLWLAALTWLATPASRWCSRSLYESKCLPFYFIQRCFARFIFCCTDFLPFQLLFSVDYLFIEVLFLFFDPRFFPKSVSPGAFALRINSRPARPAVSAQAWSSLCFWHKRDTKMCKLFCI